MEKMGKSQGNVKRSQLMGLNLSDHESTEMVPYSIVRTIDRMDRCDIY